MTRQPDVVALRGAQLNPVVLYLVRVIQCPAGFTVLSHDPTGFLFAGLAALSGMEREYVCDPALEGHEAARTRGKHRGRGDRTA